MESEHINEERYARAQKRIKEIKGFYWHLFWYILVNVVITFSNSISNFVNDGDVIDIKIYPSRFSVWFFWGIALVGHWIQVFGKNIFFSKDWEERKIKEIMDKEN